MTKLELKLLLAQIKEVLPKTKDLDFLEDLHLTAQELNSIQNFIVNFPSKLINFETKSNLISFLEELKPKKVLPSKEKDILLEKINLLGIQKINLEAKVERLLEEKRRVTAKYEKALREWDKKYLLS